MKSIPGQWNSSITRVRPFFQSLFRKDPTGKSWLPRLLSAAPAAPEHIIRNTGLLLPWVTECRSYSDRVLMKPPYEVSSPILLEGCFEKSVPPPTALLRWLIKNPSSDARLINAASNVSSKTKQQRNQLFGCDGAELQLEMRTAAISELERVRGVGSNRKWWAFEGFTEVDCYLETDSLVLLIEGKRTEPLSESTIWHKGRNQLLRNVESASEIASGKEFGVLLMSEEPIAPPNISDIDESFPHLSASKKQELVGHYWGCVTWKEACAATGIPFDDLPHTTVDVVTGMKQ